MGVPVDGLVQGIIQGIKEGLGEGIKQLLVAFGPVIDSNEEPFLVILEFATPTGTPGTLVDAASRQDRYGFDASSNFIWTSIQRYIVPTTGTNVDSTLTVQNSGSSRDFMNRAVLTEAYAGTGQRPHYLSKPYMFRPSSAIVATLTNVSGVTFNRAQVVFEGYRRWSREALGAELRA